MSVDVVTRSYDFARTGANTAETILTPAAIKTRGIKILRTFTVDDPRLEAQPLYLSGIKIGGKTRNVVYQATMANSIFAWDVDTGETLWKKNLGMPIKGSVAIDMHLVNINWGILSTPVIDRTTGALYVCAWISGDNLGTASKGVHKVFALDITTGEPMPGKSKPVVLDGITYQASPNVAQQVFNSAERKQRSALALAQGAVIICFGTLSETDAKAQGWVIAVDTIKWQPTAWCSMANGIGAGIWMSGAGPAIQRDGSIWIVTGNGDFDGKTDFGECVVRLRYTPPTASAKGTFAVAGWWTPWTDDGRAGNDSTGRTSEQEDAIDKLPNTSNAQKLKMIASMKLPILDKDWDDQDLGASGISLIENLGIGLVSSKDDILYTIKLNNPGNTTTADLATAAVPGNYAKLAAPPILYTFFDPAANPATSNPKTLNRFFGNVTHHLHGTPVVWNNKTRGQMHFCGGENGNLRAWTVKPDKSSAYLGCSSALASAMIPELANGPHGGMPGWSITLSANGDDGGVVWGMIPYGDANMGDPGATGADRGTTNGRFLAYDAANLSTFSDGSDQIMPLWDSQDWNWNFKHPKFNRPVAVDGKILMPTYDGRLLVLGLA